MTSQIVRSQILRHTAVVLAGMASIGFTVAAGTYVVNQMGTDQHEATGTPRPPDGAASPIPALPQPADPAAPQPSIVTVRFTAETRELPDVVPLRPPALLAPAASRPSAPASAAVQANTDPGTHPTLPGDAYVGANLTSPQPDSLSMTIDTNLLAPLSDPTPGAATTHLRTDLDVRHGQLTLALSNPLLGDRSIQVTPRHTSPATPDPLPASPPSPGQPAPHGLATT